MPAEKDLRPLLPIRRVLLVAGLALLGWLIHRIGAREIFALAARLGWALPAVVCLFAVHQLLRAQALGACIVGSRRPRYLDVLLVRLSGEGLQSLTAGGAMVGEPLKAWLLVERGLSGPAGLAATLAEFLAYKFVSAVTMIAALGYLLTAVALPPALLVGARVMLVVGVAFLVTAAIAIHRRAYLIGAMVSGLAGLPIVRRWPYEPAWTRQMENHLLDVLRERPRRFVAVLLLELAAHVLVVVELWWVLVRFALPAPLFHAWLIDGATKPMGGIFFFVPGQVGTNEAVLAAVFAALGLPAAAGVVVALVRRFRSALVAAAGLAGLWWLERAKPPGDRVR